MRQLSVLVGLVMAWTAGCSSSPTVEPAEQQPDMPDAGVMMGGMGGGGNDPGNVFIPTSDAGQKPGSDCEETDGGCHNYVLPADAGPACGDGIKDPGEECDDGNSLLGDGCSGACLVEPNFHCGDAGTPCVSTIACGNGRVEGGEVCDDGNTEDHDGCSGDCLSKDPNFDCSVPGEKCKNLVQCGDGQVTGDEACDDAGELGGCLDDCSGVEEGWICLRPGVACVEAPKCGDGILSRGEQCDDGNADAGDGCSDTCQQEAGFICGEVGDLCLEEVCGDGNHTLDEECDDGNDLDNDGCSACQLDEGWYCSTPGMPCAPRCGDGLIRGIEQCDDGNLTVGDGCTAGCAREAGFACGVPGDSCTETVCPDGVAEGDEGCDDGNTIAGDGCGPTCQNEPTFADGVAQLSCGDGLITGSEACDDGNSNNLDGCSSECEVETGFLCPPKLTLPESVDIAVTLRDFKASSAPGGHPDFKTAQEPYAYNGLGIVGDVCTDSGDCGELDADGKPALALASVTAIQSADSFAQWYRDDADPQDGIDIATIPGSLTLNQVAAGQDVYVYDSADFDTDATGGHWPLDGNPNAFGPTCGYEMTCNCLNDRCNGHDYHFTTELRYFFQYRGGESLTFRGDDDVWVFINGRLAVDIGGIHCREWGRVVLGDQDSSCSAHRVDTVVPNDTAAACEDAGTLEDCAPTTEELAGDTDERFGLTKGGVYEIVLFHAERRIEYSNFRLTLSGFLAPRSVCLPTCGDGIVAGGEFCDDGEDNKDDTYGACNTSCTNRQFCGDGFLNGPEECDNGFNNDGYASREGACAPGCVLPPDCGDGELQPSFEECDDGTTANTGEYNGCTADCALGPYCGDGKLDSEDGEACDDGIENGGYGKNCAVDCQPAPRCGDGERNGTEQCDLGTEQNTGEYETCNPDCSLPPRCGDGQRQAEEGEACDDGINDGGYGECAPGCQLGPRCGDGVVQSQEDCDDGMNTGEYGECAPGCRLGPRCGDGEIQRDYGETCDDGNTRSSDGCSSTCRAEIIDDPM